MKTHAEKAAAFQALHRREGIFLIPNPWDIGTARILAHLGFEALATTSAGHAMSMGQPDNSVARDSAIQHAGLMASATDLPVSADLENGFADDPQDVQETYRMAAAAGLSGASIEDSTGRPDEPIYEQALAVDRVMAVVEIARSLPFPFTVTARAENYLVGRPDLHDTIARLQAYQEAGADVLYAPGLVSRDDIAAVVRSVDKPVNVLAGMAGFALTVAELRGLGVKRISLGAALFRAALGGFLRAAREMQERGTFTFSSEAATYREVVRMFGG